MDGIMIGFVIVLAMIIMPVVPYLLAWVKEKTKNSGVTSDGKNSN